MEKRLLAAVTLSIVVMLAYPFILAKINPPKVNMEAAKDIGSEEPVMPTTASNARKPAAQETKSYQPPQAISKTSLAALLTASKVNDKYTLNFVNIGGSINKVIVKNNKRQDVSLVDSLSPESGILAIEGKDALRGASSQLFTIKEDTKTLSLETNGLKLEKNIKFLKDKYGLNADIKITNTSSEEQVISYDVITASNISKKEMFEDRFIEVDIYYKDGSSKRITGGNLLNYNRLYKDNIEWVALKNKYYSIAAKPLFNAKGVFTKSISKLPIAGFIIEDDRILPGETKAYDINFYIGPIDIRELEKVDESFGKVLNFGFLTSISLVLLSILQFFYSVFHNYGVSIIILTLCISLFLYPLTFKSLKSMQKLQELQPHIEKLRIEHKDNPSKLNKEIMELYRRYKVNPMGGCLPMLLQMPVFIALYNTLSRSIALKDAAFLWIKDLSMPDSLFHLGFSLPILGNAINLLPILMIGAMILQQKTSQLGITSVQTDQQRMMAGLMPILFGFIFYSLPSGLVLYWLTNTLLTSLMQVVLFKKTT